MLAKEQKQHEVAVSVFGLANAGITVIRDSGAALQQARTKKKIALCFF